MTMTQAEKQTGAVGARDRMRVDPDATYAKCILEPIFEFNCKYNFYPLLDAHRAWLSMLAERKIVPVEQAAPILRALDQMQQEGPDSARPFSAAAEFYYLHVERALVKRVPGGEEAVGNLNLGRTRPEPLSRMVMRQKILSVIDMALKLRRTLIKRAEAEADTVMPGYTHLLHAQPTTLGHYLLAIQDHLERDTRRLLAAYETTDQCTLGCGAMSGTSLDVDRNRVRELLGFSRLCENTIDSVSASDHVTETASALTGLMSIVGRLCQDLYVWSSQEFAMIDVTDAFASPSSLMPQKKNALVLEYMRSRTARTIGSLAGSFAVLHNVGYMDSEEVELETYQPMFEAFTMVEETLPTLEALVSVMEPNRKLMRDRAAWGFSSVTALAEEIQTKKDVSYRTAHRIVARSVLLAVEQGRPAPGIDAAIVDQAAIEMTGKPVGFDNATISQCLDPVQFVDHHDITGGTAPSQVRSMAAGRRKRLESDGKSVAEKRQALATGEKLLRQTVDKIKGN
ncbi:MAG TPA: argininosuccinate lyase [Tepidisphaeraceae bacterium]|nr:argininosuccinate lyase [Tepidisphaeraceae bacterium]